MTWNINLFAQFSRQNASNLVNIRKRLNFNERAQFAWYPRKSFEYFFRLIKWQKLHYSQLLIACSRRHARGTQLKNLHNRTSNKKKFLFDQKFKISNKAAKEQIFQKPASSDLQPLRLNQRIRSKNRAVKQIKILFSRFL